MKRRIRIRPEAASDIINSAEWYSREREGLAEAFKCEVFARVRAIAERPDSFPVVFEDVRRALLSQFPYAVHFVEIDDMISIVAVLHTSRDPDVWKQRS